MITLTITGFLAAAFIFFSLMIGPLSVLIPWLIRTLS